jgi:hypothetical protein
MKCAEKIVEKSNCFSNKREEKTPTLLQSAVCICGVQHCI